MSAVSGSGVSRSSVSLGSWRRGGHGLFLTPPGGGGCCLWQRILMLLGGGYCSGSLAAVVATGGARSAPDDGDFVLTAVVDPKNVGLCRLRMGF